MLANIMGWLSGVEQAESFDFGGNGITVRAERVGKGCLTGIKRADENGEVMRDAESAGFPAQAQQGE